MEPANGIVRCRICGVAVGRGALLEHGRREHGLWRMARFIWERDGDGDRAFIAREVLLTVSVVFVVVAVALVALDAVGAFR